MVRVEDGTTEKIYTLRVTHQSLDAFLSGISVKNGADTLTLGYSYDGGTPVAGFKRAETAYTVRVPQSMTSLTMMPVTSDPRAMIAVAGGAVSRTASGTLSATTVNVFSSPTVVSIVVMSEDSTADSRTYTVTATRPCCRSASLWCAARRR